MSTARMTTDHETIKQWTQQRGGKPAKVEGISEDDPGLLRIDFPDYGDGQNLQEISWSDFFKKFDEKGLALLYQEQTDRGQVSRFNKIVFAPQNVLRTLHAEHEKVRKVLDDMKSSTTNAIKTRPRLIQSLKELLLPHMAGEEKVIYKSLSKETTGDEHASVLEAYEEHRHARNALKRLESADPSTTDWDARAKVLGELIEHHIEEEESELFEIARSHIEDEQMQEIEQKYDRKKEQKLSKMAG